ncbi:MAG: hypothetical protein ABI563_12540 [Specibacter sp.]
MRVGHEVSVRGVCPNAAGSISCHDGSPASPWDKAKAASSLPTRATTSRLPGCPNEDAPHPVTAATSAGSSWYGASEKAEANSVATSAQMKGEACP